MLLIFNFLYIMFVFLFLCIYTNPATGCYMNKTILCVYSVALCPAHAAPHAGGQHQSYVPFRIVSVGRYVPLYHNTVPSCTADGYNMLYD